jgi:SAM-dependent methyltransferase
VEQPGKVEFGSHYFRHGCGVPYERNEHWLGFFGKVAEGIVRDLHPTSALDAGCAMGFLVEELRKRGVDASGIDISEYAISKADESIREQVRVASLSEPLGRRYDLVVCIEVLEHIPAAEADTAIANLCAASDRILLSTTPEDFGEASHVNVRPPEAWSAALAREGFFRDLERDFSYITPWAALYTKVSEPPSETVRRYDRAWWRLRREAAEVRAALLANEEKLAELRASEVEDRGELQGQLDASSEEVLRLRDLLIGKDAELGAAKGRLTELEAHSRGVMSAAARVQSRVPGAMRLIGALLRRLQGRRGRAE